MIYEHNFTTEGNLYKYYAYFPTRFALIYFGFTVHQNMVEVCLDLISKIRKEKLYTSSHLKYSIL